MATEIERLHLRIDDLGAELRARHDALATNLVGIHTTLTEVVSTYALCRQIVFGNGRDSIDKRVARLETVSHIGGRWFWLIAGAILTLFSSLIAATVAAAWGS